MGISAKLAGESTTWSSKSKFLIQMICPVSTVAIWSSPVADVTSMTMLKATTVRISSM